MNGKWTLVKRALKPCVTVETLITILAILMIAAFYRIVHEDRLLLNLYYVSIAAAAYSLVRRRAMGMMSFVMSAAASTTVLNLYLSPKHGASDRLLDPVVDVTCWCILLLLSWRLAVQACKLDVEERRLKLQRQIDESAAATRAAALTCTSHEVRTPLAAILSLTETLLCESAGPLNKLQKEFIADIDGCGKHLMALVNDILDYAKAQAGQIKLAPEVVALPELVDQCIGIVENQQRDNKITFSTQKDASVTEIVADPLRLKQILINLLSNAAKYSPNGGLVKVQIRAVDNDVLVSVRDTGRGIGPEQIKQLFDPYYQAAQGDQRIGIGLGLAIVKHLAELHNGDIGVKSSPGAGSLFNLRLPLVGPTDAASKATAGRQRSWGAVVDTKSFMDQAAVAASVL